MTQRKLSLDQFIRRYSQANRTEYEVLKAAVDKLDSHSSAHQMAKQCLDKWTEFYDYLETSGFEL